MTDNDFAFSPDDENDNGSAFDDFLSGLDFGALDEDKDELNAADNSKIDPALKTLIDSAMANIMAEIDALAEEHGIDIEENLSDVQQYIVLSSALLLWHYIHDDKHDLFEGDVVDAQMIKFIVYAAITLMQGAVGAIQSQSDSESGGNFGEGELIATYEPKNYGTYGVMLNYANWSSNADNTPSGYRECIVEVDFLKQELIHFTSDEYTDEVSEGEREALSAAIEASERGINYLLVRDIHDSL
jgi:hypothetical protein